MARRRHATRGARQSPRGRAQTRRLRPALNPLYTDVLKHYGAVALPCRVGDPDRKGNVESAIGHTQRTSLKGHRFESLEEAQAYLDRWDEQWADKRIHDRNKRQVAAIYAEVEPSLLPLPIEPLRYYQYGERTMHLDGHIEVTEALPLRATRLHRARTASAVGRPVRTADGPADQAAGARVPAAGAWSLPAPPEYRAKRTPASTLQLLTMAAQAGKHVGALCSAIHRDLGEVGVKRIPGRALAAAGVRCRRRG